MVKIKLTNLCPKLLDHFTIGNIYEVDELDFYPKSGNVVVNSEKVLMFGPIMILKSEFEVLSE